MSAFCLPKKNESSSERPPNPTQPNQPTVTTTDCSTPFRRRRRGGCGRRRRRRRRQRVSRSTKTTKRARACTIIRRTSHFRNDHFFATPSKSAHVVHPSFKTAARRHPFIRRDARILSPDISRQGRLDQQQTMLRDHHPHTTHPHNAIKKHDCDDKPQTGGKGREQQQQHTHIMCLFDVPP